MSQKYTFTIDAPPIERVANHFLNDDEDFCRDLLELANIPDSVFEEFCTALEGYSAIATTPVLQELAAQAGIENTPKLAHLLESASRLVHRAYEPHKIATAKFLEMLSESREHGLDEATANKAKERLERAAFTGGVAVARKAESLAKATGESLNKLDLICDLRPVFGIDRDEITSFLPVTTLHIEHSGDSANLDIVLTLEQLDSLCTKVAEVQNKLKLLNEYSTVHSITLHNVKERAPDEND